MIIYLLLLAFSVCPTARACRFLKFEVGGPHCCHRATIALT